MKVIDLLNKIANDEEVPKKIKYDDRFYIFNEKKDNYYENETCSINWDYVALHCLNEEIEIIEEPKKIEKIDTEWLKNVNMTDLKTYEIIIEETMKKLNNIIDYINKEQ